MQLKLHGFQFIIQLFIYALHEPRLCRDLQRIVKREPRDAAVLLLADAQRVPIVRFEHDPNDPEHSGWFVPTGERFMRRHIEKMANEGVFVDDDWFNPQAVF